METGGRADLGEDGDDGGLTVMRTVRLDDTCAQLGALGLQREHEVAWQRRDRRRRCQMHDMAVVAFACAWRKGEGRKGRVGGGEGCVVYSGRVCLLKGLGTGGTDLLGLGSGENTVASRQEELEGDEGRGGGLKCAQADKCWCAHLQIMLLLFVRARGGTGVSWTQPASQPVSQSARQTDARQRVLAGERHSRGIRDGERQGDVTLDEGAPQRRVADTVFQR